MRIVFMGTPDFAVATLKTLVESGYDIAAVITAPDKPYGRGGKKISVSSVKKYALSQDLNILQPTNLKDAEFQTELASLKADVQIVVAFRMLPVAVWDMPPLGTYNLHGSLLPKYRGAAPINWAIMRGETKTGLTTFKLKHEIDTGSVLFRKEIPIYSSDGLKEVHDRMMNEGARLMLKSVRAIESETARLVEQQESAVTHAPKLFHPDLVIDFDQPVRDVYNYIRGLSPFPASWTTLDGKKMKLFKVTISHNETGSDIGLPVTDNKKYISIACQDGAIQVEELQLEGRRRMAVADFLRGWNPN